ncbi:hypothetical protein ACFOTA_19545 [Chitinophaga sp. GCM10012297]|uniref:Secreted protein n=1 Tax=Chitinophaga chungangae TaxID=2821488 RepID=A0ABS3YJE0_9BACT|nr:hypothetical protein [Chitinophaga chungangae]MBO9154418.1 hypothetical protein [Chitinophaga chungangae]
MKSRIVPLGVLGLMIAFVVAQAGNGFTGESTLPVNQGYSLMAKDTVPENPQDTMKKKRKKDKKKDKDTSNLPKPDTFKTSFRP